MRPPAPAVPSDGAGADHVYAVVSAAIGDVRITALRIGFALMLISSVSDAAFALVAGGGARGAVEGVALSALAAAGLGLPERAAVLLTPPGRIVLVAAIFAGVGIAEWSVQQHFAEVALAIVWFAVIVSSTRWVVLTVAISAVGYVAGLAAQGHTAGWMIDGPGRDLVINQTVDLIANAAAVTLLVTLLRRFLRSVPARLIEARAGAGVLAPQLNSAVSGDPTFLLDRGDASGIVFALSEGERNVVGLLVAGLVPKQAALVLGLSLAAVRSRIANAKRKTGARTLDQLVAL
ncbi:MAG: helix-turn-helix transcriptional regulator [Solirubrobacteraceae bacterium]